MKLMCCAFLTSLFSVNVYSNECKKISDQFKQEIRTELKKSTQGFNSKFQKWERSYVTELSCNPKDYADVLEFMLPYARLSSDKKLIKSRMSELTSFESYSTLNAKKLESELNSVLTLEVPELSRNFKRESRLKLVAMTADKQILKNPKNYKWYKIAGMAKYYYSASGLSELKKYKQFTRRVDPKVQQIIRVLEQ